MWSGGAGDWRGLSPGGARGATCVRGCGLRRRVRATALARRGARARCRARITAPPSELQRAEGVAECEYADDDADHGLEVDERAGELGRDAGLAERVEGEREQRAEADQRDHRDQLGGAGGGGRGRAEQSERQRRGAGGRHLHRGHRDRVAAGQQPDWATTRRR